MQDEITQKTISVCLKTGEASERTLKAALQALLRKRQAYKEKQAQQNPEADEKPRKQTLKAMQKRGQELTSIDITYDNIRSFERYARKYNVSYALKKDKNANPPRYFVFFRARDAAVMTAAFKEYAGDALSPESERKPSVRHKLKRHVRETMPHRQRVREQKKER